MTFSAKLDPGDKVTFNLRYEELLQRSENGQYDYGLHLKPENQKIDDFHIKIEINESLPLKDISVKRFLNQDQIKSQVEKMATEGLLVFDQKNDPQSATIEMFPSGDNNNGEDWKLVLNYDVERPRDGNDIQIGAGKFVHYFAPDELPTMPKHVIFVIDRSYSMEGRKLQQTKDALTTMLDKMSKKNIDNFNIILFDSGVEVWGREGCYLPDYMCKDVSYNIQKSNGDVGPAYDFLLDMVVRGSTNINDAILEAVNIAKEVKYREEINKNTQQMIVFLTDGQPSDGETYGPKIKENVREANAETRIPIYGLALGDDADFDLIKDISNKNYGFAERIYESGNSFEQLENFYNKISGKSLLIIKVKEHNKH